MLKPILFASTALFLLCGPALADPTPSATNYDLGLVVASGNQTRHYALTLVDQTCGGITAKDSGKSEDSIHICLHGGAVEVDWLTRESQREVVNKSTVAVKRGASFVLDGGDAKLTVSVR